MQSYTTLYTIDEAADVLRISRATLYSHMSEGRLPFVQIGRRRFITSDDLVDFIERNRVGPERSSPVTLEIPTAQ